MLPTINAGRGHNVHLYYVQRVTVKLVGVGGTTTKVFGCETKQADYCQQQSPRQRIRWRSYRGFLARKGLREVLLPTWSNENGQDDLIWHKGTETVRW